MGAAVWNTYLKPRSWICSDAPPEFRNTRLCLLATAAAVAADAEPQGPNSKSTLSSLISFSYRRAAVAGRSEEHTSELQSLMRISYAVFCLKKKKNQSITIADI